MYHYYQNRPSTITTLNVSAQTQASTSSETLNMSEFDKHRETLLAADVEEGWASELRRYLATMQRDVTKHTDIIEWWQVSTPKCINLVIYLLYILRTMLSSIQHLRVSRSTSFQLKHHPFLVNGCSRVRSKLQLIAGHVWVQKCLKSSPSWDLHGDRGYTMLLHGMPCSIRKNTLVLGCPRVL